MFLESLLGRARNFALWLKRHSPKLYNLAFKVLRTFIRFQSIFNKNGVAAHYVRRREGFIVVRHGGMFMVSHKAERFSSAAAKIRNLDEIVAICANANISYSWVPGFSDARERVLIHHKDRKVFLDTANWRLRNKGFYLSDDTKNKKRFALVDGHGLPRRLYSTDVVYAFHLESKNSVTFADVNNRCDVEFWFDELEARHRGMADDTMFDGKQLGEVQDVWIAPTSNRVATILTSDQRELATKTISGKSYGAFLPFAKKYSDDLDIDFPIDAVYTWVDGDDPKWREKYDSARKQLDPSFVRGNGEARYTSRDELRYSLRGLAMYAPWFRHIYVVTDHQRPKWLREDDRLHLVAHDEIFTDTSVLPVFNSHAIETQLRNIPGLSEHFVYFNDDVFLTLNTSPSLFFTESGLAKLSPSRALFGAGGQVSPESIATSAGQNDADLLEIRFGRRPAHKFSHSPLPQLRSVHDEVAQLWPIDFSRTACSPFRDQSDISPVYLVNHYSLMTGRAVLAQYKLRVMNIALWDDNLARMTLHDKPNAMCINDTVDLTDRQRKSIEPQVRRFLERMFPFRSPWER